MMGPLFGPANMTACFDQAHLSAVVALMGQVAANELMPRFGRLQRDQIHEKTSAFDVVTEADEAAERAIAAGLRAAFPGADVVGEEATGRDPAMLDLLGSSDQVFVVDPLDGTKNFASGLPLFGVMVAVVVRGDVVASVIHDPVGQTTACALRGQGAWLLTRDGQRMPLCVAAAQPVKQMHGIVSTNFVPEPLRTQVNARLSSLATTNWFRCAAHEYRLAAAGHVDVLFYNKLMPWDHAAGWLLHQEAGGYSAHFDGSPYRPTHTTGGLLCAPDRASWDAVRRALLG